jgi:hypothetical protein
MIGHFQGEDKKSPLPCKEIHAPGHNGRKMSYKYTAVSTAAEGTLQAAAQRETLKTIQISFVTMGASFARV